MDYIAENARLAKLVNELLVQQHATIEIRDAIVIAKQEAAANTIRSAYKSKMKTDESTKILSDYICSNLGNALTYRSKLPDHMNKLYLYYCKLGKKSFGYRLDKKVGSYAVKQISNSVFVNTSFASTNFTGIKFKSCKFISGGPLDLTGYAKGMNERSRALTSRHPDASQNNKKIIFNNCKLTNCLIEDCRFYGTYFDDIIYGSDITDTHISELGDVTRYTEATRFLNCVFNSTVHTICIEGLSSMKNIICPRQPMNGEKTTNYRMTFKSADSINSWANEQKKNIFHINRTDKTVDPFLVYETSKFNNVTFASESSVRNILFLKCEFKTDANKSDLANKITFNFIEFRECNFNGTNFSFCRFDNCTFNQCTFTNVTFHACDLAGDACVMQRCVFHDDCVFFNCIFVITDNLKKKLQFDTHCILSGVKFQFNYMIGYAFNEYNTTTPDTSHTNHMLMMKKCTFYRNILFGTSFDYCDLEGSFFFGPEEINWFGNVLLSVDKRNMLRIYDETPESGATNVYEIVKKHKLISIKHSYRVLAHILEESEYIRSGFPGGSEEFIKTYNIRPWDYINSATDRIFYFLPATSFEGANIKTCNFQSMMGFEGFDFTQLAKYKLSPDDQPTINLNAVNFTDVNLTNANFEGAILIGTIFQVAVVNSANFEKTITNEHTDFENTIGIATILNGEHINFGELQNNANETHSRANLIINNRNKYKEYYSIYKNEDNIDFFYYNEMHIIYHAPLMKFMNENHHDIDVDRHQDYRDNFANTNNMIANNIDEIWFEITISELHRDRNKEQARTKPLPINNLFDLKYSVDEVLSGSLAPHAMYCNQDLKNFIAMGIINRLQWNKTQLVKLKADLDIIIDESFMKIVTSRNPPLNKAPDDAMENWCWLDLIVESLLFLFSCPALYINTFFEFYFNEVFNAHGAGSRSCTLGMVERLVTIHSQTTESFIMTMDVKPTQEIAEAISQYSTIDTTKKDPQITVDFITNFNKPQFIDNVPVILSLGDEILALSMEKDAAKKEVENADKEMYILEEKIYALREEMIGAVKESKLSTNLDKYKLNKFLNLLKPNSTLPENAEDDIGINLDFDIKGDWRDEFMVSAKVEVDNGEIKTLDDLTKYYLIWMTKKILVSNNITDALIETIKKKNNNQTKLLVTKLKELDTFLKTNEIPQFKEAVIMMTSSNVTYEELVDYFEGGRKSLLGGVRSRTRKTQNASNKSIFKNSRSIRIGVNKIDRALVKSLVTLPTDKISAAFKKSFARVPAYIPRKMTFEDPVYRRILKKRILKIRATNEAALDNYIKTLKKSTLEKRLTVERAKTMGGSMTQFAKKQNSSIGTRRRGRSGAALKKTTLKRRKKYYYERKRKF